MQKEFTVDFLHKKKKKNEGEIPQYYVKGDHAAIIEPEVFDHVQVEMARHMNCDNRYSGVSIFSSRIRCGECGGKKQMKQFIRDIEDQEPVKEFDEGIWCSLVDCVTVYSGKRMEVTFKDGTEV